MKRPQTRRKRSGRGLAVLVPGIDEFRDVMEIEAWFGDRAPICATSGCCGRRINEFDADDEGDRGLAEVHNVTAWLGLVRRMLDSPDRMEWLRAHRAAVLVAYTELQAATGVRAIRPYASASVWLDLAD